MASAGSRLAARSCSKSFEGWSLSAARFHVELNAAYAFPDPSDPHLMHTVIWAKENLPQLGPVSESLVATAEDPDTFDAYGSGEVEHSAITAVRCNIHEPLAGFMRDDHPGATGPPMIGFFKRRIKPGRLEALASSFQVVCDLARYRPRHPCCDRFARPRGREHCSCHAGVCRQGQLRSARRRVE